MSQSSDAPRLGVIAAFAAVYTIWGSTYLAIRFFVAEMPPLLLAGARHLTAGIILYTIMRLRGVPHPRLIHWRTAVVVGGLLLLGGNGAVSWAEQELPSGLMALIVATLPLWMVMFDWLRPQGTPPAKQVLVGVAMGLVGMAVLIGPDLLAKGERFSVLSILVALLAPLVWAAGSIYSRHNERPESPLMGTASQMLAGGMMLVILAVFLGEPAQFHPLEVSLRAWLSWAYLVVFGSLVAFSAYIWILQVSTPARVSTYAYVNPVIAVVLGWLFAGEELTIRTIIAAAIIIVAVMIITTYQRPVAVPTGEPAVVSAD